MLRLGTVRPRTPPATVRGAPSAAARPVRRRFPHTAGCHPDGLDHQLSPWAALASTDDVPPPAQVRLVTSRCDDRPLLDAVPCKTIQLAIVLISGVPAVSG